MSKTNDVPKQRDKAGIAKATKAKAGKGKLSLYPLDLETALGAALKTGGPPPETEKKKTTVKPR